MKNIAENVSEDDLFPSRSLPLTGPDHWSKRHLRATGDPITPLPGRRHLDFELARFFRRHLASRRGGTLLEIGCGSSVWLPYFDRKFGLTVTGLDYSEQGLAVCQRILARTETSAELVRGDIFDPEFRFDRFFDIVFSLGFIEHFSNPTTTIARMGRYLRPGGLFLTWVPNAAGAAERISRRLDSGVAQRQRKAGREEWIEAHRKAGLTVLEAYHGQGLDFSHINVSVFPPTAQKILGLAFRTMSLPFLALEKGLGVRIGIGPLCSGLFLAAQSRPARKTPR